MFISPDRLDMLAHYMAATGMHTELINMLVHYGKEFERIKEEDIARGINLALQQDEPMYSMGD